MSPGPRRDLTPFVIVLVVGAIVLFLFVGGLASVGRASGPFHATIDRSFGAQARLVAEESNQLGDQLNTVVDQMAGYHRIQLAQSLDSLVTGAESVASSAELLSSPAPEGGAGQNFVLAMTDRALGIEQLRTTVDGLLALSPQGGSAAFPLPPPRVSATLAVQQLAAAGRLLIGADQAYGRARHEFLAVPGGSRLPASVWVPQPVVWGAGATQTTVNQLTSAPQLAAFLDVHLVAVSLNPAVLPPAPAVPGQPAAPALVDGAAAVPPTCTLTVTAVVRNDGTVVVSNVPVEAAVEPIGGGPPFPVKKQVTLAPSASVAITLPVLPVTPGTTYDLAVNLVAPAGQRSSTGPIGTAIAIATYGSVAGNRRCARVPAAAP